MTLDERVQQVWDGIIGNWHRQSSQPCKDIIRRALIEQDKITRHADLDAALGVFSMYGNEGGTWPDGMASSIEQAVMNCKGGVE